METEYVASATATKEAIWLRTLLEELNFTQTTATIIKADNQGCIALAHNPVSHSRAKHIDIRHYFIQERIQRDEIAFQYISTKDMLANIFTKSLPRKTFVKFRTKLGVLPSEWRMPQWGGVSKYEILFISSFSFCLCHWYLYPPVSWRQL